MKQKIKKIIFLIAEIGTVVWAVYEIILKSRSCSFLPHIGSGFNCDYNTSQILAYFLSAVLILYLLRKYEMKG